MSRVTEPSMILDGEQKVNTRARSSRRQVHPSTSLLVQPSDCIDILGDPQHMSVFLVNHLQSVTSSLTYNWYQVLIPFYFDFQTIVSHLTIVLFQFNCVMHRPRRRRVGFFLQKSQAGPPLGPGTRQEFCT